MFFLHPILSNGQLVIQSVQTSLPNNRKSRLICVRYEPTSKPVPLCTRQVSHRTSFLSKQRDVIASLSFGACIVYTEFLMRIVFLNIYQHYLQYLL